MTETTAFQFTRESAIAKVRAAEDAWNGQNPEQIALARPTVKASMAALLAA